MKSAVAMKFALLLCFATFLAGGARAQSAHIDELFKWGEYDSLIRVLEPAVARPEADSALASKSDSAAYAKSLLYLGVAYYATGRITHADQSFARACALNPEITLDRFYVTEQIAFHFQGIARERRRLRQQQSALTAVRNLPAAGGSQTSLESREDKSWLWWGLGMTAVVAAGGSAYLISNQPGKSENITKIDADPE